MVWKSIEVVSTTRSSERHDRRSWSSSWKESFMCMIFERRPCVSWA
jgi:hypothetical protein